MNERSTRLSNDKDVWYWSETMSVKVNDEVKVPADCNAIIIYNGKVMDDLKPGSNSLNADKFPVLASITGLSESKYDFTIIYIRNKPHEIKWAMPMFNVADKNNTILTLSASGSAQLAITNTQKFYEINYPAIDIGIEQQDAIKRSASYVIIQGAVDHITEEAKAASLKDQIRISSAKLVAAVKEKGKTKMEDYGFELKNINLEELSLFKLP